MGMSRLYFTYGVYLTRWWPDRLVACLQDVFIPTYPLNPTVNLFPLRSFLELRHRLILEMVRAGNRELISFANRDVFSINFASVML